MAEENKINGLAWFVAGLGVGALVGILYAPKAGRELREDLANGTRQAADKMGDLVGKGREHVGEYVDRGRAQWEEFVERGKSLVAEQTGRVTAAVEAGRQAYKTPPVPEPPAEG
jgi:gas vesicle protein